MKCKKIKNKHYLSSNRDQIKSKLNMIKYKQALRKGRILIQRNIMKIWAFWIKLRKEFLVKLRI